VGTTGGWRRSALQETLRTRAASNKAMTRWFCYSRGPSPGLRPPSPRRRRGEGIGGVIFVESQCLSAFFANEAPELSPGRGAENVAGGKRSAATGFDASSFPFARPGGAADLVPPPNQKIEGVARSGGRASLAAGYLLGAPPARGVPSGERDSPTGSRPLHRCLHRSPARDDTPDIPRHKSCNRGAL
jgi:hypothetical protein